MYSIPRMRKLETSVYFISHFTDRQPNQSHTNSSFRRQLLATTKKRSFRRIAEQAFHDIIWIDDFRQNWISSTVQRHIFNKKGIIWRKLCLLNTTFPNALSNYAYWNPISRVVSGNTCFSFKWVFWYFFQIKPAN